MAESRFDGLLATTKYLHESVADLVAEEAGGASLKDLMSSVESIGNSLEDLGDDVQLALDGLYSEADGVDE
jgi:hypothetical protein